MKFIFIIPVVLLLFFSMSQAQEPANRDSLPSKMLPGIGKVSGEVVDSATGKPIAYASVGVVNVKDSTGVAGMLSSDKGKFNIYSGDVLQSGAINGSNKAAIRSNLPSFLHASYNINDVTGDGIVDESDFRIIENNAATGITVQHP